jgi:hypothetical protein
VEGTHVLTHWHANRRSRLLQRNLPNKRICHPYVILFRTTIFDLWHALLCLLALQRDLQLPLCDVKASSRLRSYHSGQLTVYEWRKHIAREKGGAVQLQQTRLIEINDEKHETSVLTRQQLSFCRPFCFLTSSFLSYLTLWSRSSSK